MTVSAERGATSRREAMAKARQSRRPSRLGAQAGTAAEPDRILADDEGFPGLLARVWAQARNAPDLPSAVDTLLTLGGVVPADVQLRALRLADECALKILFGVSWRDGVGTCSPRSETGGPPAFAGAIGMTTGGRVAVGVPSRGPLAEDEDLVAGVIHVPWSANDLARYLAEMRQANAAQTLAVADCRRWIKEAGEWGREDLVAQLTEAAIRTAPFVLYQEGKRYTNFRERNTLVGKTLWPGHPDCALGSLSGIPLELWSDGDVLMVVCLTLLIRSGGFARIEEVNGTQLSVDHVADLLERKRRAYNRALGVRSVPAAASSRPESLDCLATALREQRAEVSRRVQMYREIHGPLMHKIERVAAKPGDAARGTEETLCRQLRERLPVGGHTLADCLADIEANRDWLSRPADGFGTGLESLVYETVAAAMSAFKADFAMSRGMRSLPSLIEALRENDWAKIAQWEILNYFCCVVPAQESRRYFGGSLSQLADVAWAISSRMQYNSWHFIAANLPEPSEVAARDYFVPPVIPDIAYYSDQHHRGHVAAKVRFSIRSPRPVDILGRKFAGFVDLRLLRCEGHPFGEPDLLAAHETSAFIAGATSLAASLVAEGASIEVTSFDSRWHWETIVEKFSGAK
jgi:hypothetical protein